MLFMPFLDLFLVALVYWLGSLAAKLLYKPVSSRVQDLETRWSKAPTEWKRAVLKRWFSTATVQYDVKNSDDRG